MEIRPPSDRADARGAAVAHDLAWREAYDGLLPESVLSGFDADPDDEAVEDWYERLRETGEPGLVAGVDGDVVGYALFRWSETKPFVPPDAAGLKEIYVHPEHWGNGVGTALLDTGIDRLPERASALSLEMFADNEVGRGFYESRGFERVDESSVEVAGESYPTVLYELEL